MGGQNLAALRDFFMTRLWLRLASEAGFQLLGLDQIHELVVLPFPAADLSPGMDGLQLPFPGLRQGIAQAPATQLRGPTVEAMEVSGPCHEHLQVVTVQV